VEEDFIGIGGGSSAFFRGSALFDGDSGWISGPASKSFMHFVSKKMPTKLSQKRSHLKWGEKCICLKEGGIRGICSTWDVSIMSMFSFQGKHICLFDNVIE
jgi:hypothetical protein